MNLDEFTQRKAKLVYIRGVSEVYLKQNLGLCVCWNET